MDRNQSFEIEFQVLVSACAAHFNKSETTRLKRLIECNAINWPHLLQLARVHQIRPLLLRALTSLQTQEIPEETIAELKRVCKQIMLFNFEQTKEVLRLLKLFKENDVKAILYKGVVLAHSMYGDISLREFSDIDLLIDGNDLDQIGTLLLKEGFEPELQLTPVEKNLHLINNCEFNFDFHRDGIRAFHVECHWTVVNRIYQIFIALNDLSDGICNYQIANHSIETPAIPGEL